MKQVPVSELLKQDNLNLSCCNQISVEKSFLKTKEINRPGLALSGFFEEFAGKRIQILGNCETAYLKSLEQKNASEKLENLLEYEIPCLVFTHDKKPEKFICDIATKHSIPLLSTCLATNRFIELIIDYLDRQFSASTVVHGVLVEVFGVGILIKGKSGVGKSETALELVERGHRLVADDIVDIVCRGGNRLYGQVSDVIEHHMEIRGLGIINIKDLFGAGSVRNIKRINLIINLEDWDEAREYDRLGLEDRYQNILGVNVFEIIIPIRPGRHAPILIEIAAKNFRLRQRGVHAAKDFNKNLLLKIEEKKREGKRNGH